jgi:hypothetical protein
MLVFPVDFYKGLWAAIDSDKQIVELLLLDQVTF